MNSQNLNVRTMARHVALVVANVLVALFATGCADSEAPPPEQQPSPPVLAPLDPGTNPAVSSVVDAAGATLVSADGALKLDIPANALAGGQTITARPFPPTMVAVEGFVPGTGYTFGPDGLDFAQPVQLSLRYDRSKLPANFDEANLALAKIRDDGRYELARNIRVDTSAGVVSGDIGGFSSWGVLTGCNGLVAALPELTVQAVTDTTVTIAVGPVQTTPSNAPCPYGTYYELERAPADDAREGTYMRTGLRLYQPPSGTATVLVTRSLEDMGLPSGKSFRYRLFKNVSGPFGQLVIPYPPDRSIVATTLPASSPNPQGPPRAPAHFVAAPDYETQAPYIVTGYGKRIHLNWSPVPESDHYVISRREGNGAFVEITRVKGVTEFFDKPIDPQARVRFEYQLIVENSAGQSAPVTAGASTESGPPVEGFCFDSDATWGCDFFQLPVFRVETDSQATIPFNITPPAYQVQNGSPPYIFPECDIYFALFNPGHGISQPASGAYSDYPLHTGPNVLHGASTYRVTMTLDVAADASLGVHYATLYATGCMGPVVAKQPIALDVRPKGRPYRLTVGVPPAGSITSNPGQIDCHAGTNPICDDYYAPGTQVVLTAVPPQGSMVLAWGGDCSGSTTQFLLTMDGDKTCSVTFTSTVPPPPSNVRPRATRISAGSGFSIAVKADGTLWLWGDFVPFKLATTNCVIPNSQDAPCQVVGPAGIIAAAAGSGFVVALQSNGEVIQFGHLPGTIMDVNSDVATPIAGLSGVTQVAAGYGHALALRSDGSILAWGAAGLLGDGSGTGSATPVAVPIPGTVTTIAASGSHSIALTASGDVWVWGQDGPHLGLGASAPYEVPAATHVTALAGAGITSIAAGSDSSLFIDTSGAVRYSGRPVSGVLAQETVVPTLVAAFAPASAAAEGSFYDMVSHELSIWVISVDPTAVPHGFGKPANVINVANLSKIVELAAGNGEHALFADESGALWASGDNTTAALGDGTRNPAAAPVRVLGINVN